MPPAREFREYSCGCYYDKTEADDGQLLALRMRTCSVCMDAAFATLDDLVLAGKDQLTLGLASATGAAEAEQ